MNIKDMTPAQIQQAGLEALARALGPVGMVRFLQQFELGSGDYSVDRHEWLDPIEAATLLASIQQRRVAPDDSSR